MAALQRHALPSPRSLKPPHIAGALRSGRGLLAMAVALALGVAVLQVNQFSLSASTGYQIDSLNSIRAAQQAQNHQLEAEVASLASLARVDWEARVRLHMQPATRKLYISVNQPTPPRETLPSRFLPQPPAAPGRPAPAGESIWERLRRLLPF